MRDPNRIDRILATLRTEWVMSPDLRLGQLIVNAIRPSRPCPQVFFTEDTVVEAGLMSSSTEPRATQTAHEVVLELTSSESLVLFELVSRFSEQEKLSVEDPAEAKVLNKVCGLLEKQLVEPFEKNWLSLLDQARRTVCPVE